MPVKNPDITAKKRLIDCKAGPKSPKNLLKNKKGDFWFSLPRPFFVLAPMANVTDSVFRKLFAKYGRPDVTWTEFVSADGLATAGQKKLLIDLAFSKKEKPIVAQLFGSNPERMEKAAALVAKLGYDGLDLNMGCPDRAVEKQGGGSAMIKNPEKALAILEAARRGVGEQKILTKSKVIPVSVKTRLGYNKIDLDWIKFLLEQKLPALTVHLRTRREMSEVPAHWEVMPEIVSLRNRISPETLIIGNGDVESLNQANDYALKYGCDGVMIGRGIFGKPWFFQALQKRRKGNLDINKKPSERLKILLEHARLFEKTFKGIKSFDIMRKHFKAYVSGWDGAKELRVKLFECKNAREVGKMVEDGE